MTDPNRPHWLDTKINLQTLFTGALGAAVALVLVYISLIGRVSTLEEHDKQQEQHFARVEASVTDLRLDVKEQLRNISSDVKDTNGKLDTLHDQLISNSAGNRPDTRRWTK